jgi:hypothetical protein
MLLGVMLCLAHKIQDRLLPDCLHHRYSAFHACPKRHSTLLRLRGKHRYPQRATTYSPEYVRSLIERFPGLHFDLAVPAPSHVYRPSGHRDSTLFEFTGRIKDTWLALLEKYPERFLSASDYRPPVEAWMSSHIADVQRKLILDSLLERARHLVAYGNAWRLITGGAWR